MPIGTSRLSLLAFPQHWDGSALAVRFLCLPRERPDIPLGAGLPDFAHANLVFSARLVPSLDNLPTTAGSIEDGPLVLTSRPLNKAAIFGALAQQFEIVPRVAVARPKPTFSKVAPESYNRVAGTTRRSRYLRAAGDYECALHGEGPVDPNEEPPVLDTSLTWGKVIAYALRQPALAEPMGLVGEAAITPVAGQLAAGGWLFVDLHGSSDGAGAAGLVARYAARIPPLTAGVSRSLFAAILFPVDAPIPADDVFREAEIYDNGLAKQVHGAQVFTRIANAGLRQGTDAIQLGWDDEQIAIWLNRQADVLPTRELALDAPCGVAGYRVDVRAQGTTEWHSLMRTKSTAALALGAVDLGSFEGESLVEAIPAQDAKAMHGEFWLPPYFASWHGGSLALGDTNIAALQMHAESQVASFNPQLLLTREKVFEAVDAAAVPLRYGRSYEFRTRLADLTRGGPDWTVEQPAAPATGVTAIDFKRRLKPGPFNRLFNGAAPRTIVIEKPRLGLPEALFAGASLDDVKADLDVIAASFNPADNAVGIPRAPGVFDPDVVAARVEVSVKALDNDAADYMPLCTTERAMPGATLDLPLDFQDVPRLDAFAEAQPNNGPLALPTAREVRLTLIPIGREDDNYFHDEAARIGDPIVVNMRVEAGVEDTLIADSPLPATALQSFFFQPSAPDSAPPCARLGTELALDFAGTTLSGKNGRRTVFGCSAALRHTLSPESGSLTFASSSDLFSRWINVVRFTVLRDWTWGGLAHAGMVVKRKVVRTSDGTTTEAVVGTIQFPRGVAARSRPDATANCRHVSRQSTEVVFVDAVDPKPGPAEWPSELTIEYTVEPAYFTAPPPAAWTRDIDVPITTPPAQVPRVVGAGLALSRYTHADDYSGSDPRRRSLWFEFDAPPADPGDEYFVRIVGYAPDPLLLQRDSLLPDAPEPPLPIDPESMRMITPGQPHDDRGLSAMTGIAPSPRDEKRYCLVPIPEGMNEESPELFGFFVYEVRLGHKAGRWCTAQGRFGPPLRVSGVQHPAPALTCSARRGSTAVRVMAPFADAVHEGRNLRPRFPRSQLWALLYARVRQLDAASWRNVLLAQQRLIHDPHQDLQSAQIFGEGDFALAEVRSALGQLGLADNTPLTTMAVEVFGEPDVDAPLGANLGHARILRVSPLMAVPDAC